MSDITRTPFGAAEHCRLDNWAAEYAKKLVEKEERERYDADTAAAAARDAAISSAVSDERSEREAADARLDAAKADKTVYASTTQAGLIKLHKGGSGNNSGIEVDQSDGTAYVKTSETYGTRRDGAGQIQIVAATEAEINSGIHQYKPIVPATVKHAVEKIAGKAADLPAVRLDLDDGTYMNYRASDLVGTAVNLNTAVNEEREAREAAVSEVKAGLSSLTGRLCKWTAAPQQIGTWEIPAPATIPPTMPKIYPVWRVGIPLTAVQDISSCFINVNKTGVYCVNLWDILQKLGFIKESGEIILLSWKMFFKNGNEYDPNWSATGVTENPDGQWYIDQDFEENADAATYFYGWVEFAAPASNIAVS